MRHYFSQKQSATLLLYWEKLLIIWHVSCFHVELKTLYSKVLVIIGISQLKHATFNSTTAKSSHWPMARQSETDVAAHSNMSKLTISSLIQQMIDQSQQLKPRPSHLDLPLEESLFTVSQTIQDFCQLEATEMEKCDTVIHRDSFYHNMTGTSEVTDVEIRDSLHLRGSSMWCWRGGDVGSNQSHR